MGRVIHYHSRQRRQYGNVQRRRYAHLRLGRRYHRSTGALTNASIDLGAGNDTLTFGNFTNSATVANTETITGGTGADTVTLGTALTTAMSVDLGTGANKLTLANGGNTGTVSNVRHADRRLRRRCRHPRHRARSAAPSISAPAMTP